MKALLLLILTSCGGLVELTEGLYEITLIETSNSCGWPNGDTGRFTWSIYHVGKQYGIERAGNGETLSCTSSSDTGEIFCAKDKEATVGDCIYQVAQTVTVQPENETSFEGTFGIDFISCTSETCGQTAVIKGEWYGYLPTR